MPEARRRSSVRTCICWGERGRQAAEASAARLQSSIHSFYRASNREREAKSLFFFSYRELAGFSSVSGWWMVAFHNMCSLATSRILLYANEEAVRRGLHSQQL